MSYQPQIKIAAAVSPPAPPENGKHSDSSVIPSVKSVEAAETMLAGAGLPPLPRVAIAGPSEPAIILEFGQQVWWRLNCTSGPGGSITPQRVIKDASSGADVRVFDADDTLHFGAIGERDMRPVLHSDGSWRLTDEPRYYRQEVTLGRGDEIKTRGEFSNGFQLTGMYLVIQRANGHETAIRIPHENAGGIDRYLDIKYQS